MTQAADTQPPRPEPDEIRQQLAGKHACPFCGVIRVDPQAACPRCTMDDTPATRQATRQRIGPWFVLQARNPSAPGMKFGTLLSLVRKQHITPRSIVRGPTTHQLWTFAVQVRGLSREFGLCYQCGESIDRTATVCPHCDRQQLPPPEPDALLELHAQEMVVTSQPISSDTGMDGGTSLDLQVEPPGMARPAPRPVSQVSMNKPPQRPASPVREMSLANVKEESILTARELAAAFQLDFKAPVQRAPRKPIGPVKMMAGLVLIGGIATAIVFTLRPEWRDRSFAWADDQWTYVRSSLEQPADRTKMTLPPVTPRPNESTPIDKSPTPTDTPPAPKPPARVEPPRPIAPPVAEAPKPTPARTPIDPDVPIPDAPPVVVAKPEVPTPEIVKTEAPKPVANTPDASTPPASKPPAVAIGTPGAGLAPVKIESIGTGFTSPNVETPKPEAPKPEAAKPEPPKPEAPKVEVAKVEAPKPEAPKAEPPKTEPPKPEPVKPEPVKPVDPAPVAVAAAPTSPPPSAPVATKPLPRPTPPKPAVKPALPPIVIPKDVTDEQAIEIASELRNRAIDAEVRKDWKNAIDLYTQIGTLPRDAWPADLQLRLDAARRKMG